MESTIIDWSSATPIYTYNSKNYYNPFRSNYKNIRYTIPSQGKYTVTAGDTGRIAMISYKVYGDTCFWRALLEYNGLKNPVSDIYPGLVLNLPNKSALVSLLSDTPHEKQNSISSTITI